MRKFILAILAFMILGASEALAAGLTVKVEVPGSPTNKRDFRLGFVALDIQNRSVAVDCYFRKPGGSYVKWETKSLPAGGDSDYCQVDSGEISERGTYDFYVVATAGGETVTSDTVSVEYDDVGPGTPVSYSKEPQPDGCSYKIKFKTADDSGETARVELYRSENPSFGVDGGSRIASQGIGSNLEGEFYTSLPDCGKKYYFAIRAFDGHGNGSGVIGDIDGVVTVTEGGEVTGAIPVGESMVSQAGGQGAVGGQVLGEEEDGEGEVTVSGEAASDEVLPEAVEQGLERKIIKYGIGAIILGLLGYFVMATRRK